MKKMNKNQMAFLNRAHEVAKAAPVITRQEILMIEKEGLKWPHWFTNNKSFRVNRGTYKLPDITPTNNID
jgi:hypothetical protein